MRKNVKKVIAPLLAAAMALSCTVCVSAAEDETIKLTVWGAEEDQNLLKELTDKFQEKYADQKFDIQIGVESESTAKDTDKGIGYDSYIQINTFILFFRPCGCWYDSHLLTYFFQQIMRFFRNKRDFSSII